LGVSICKIDIEKWRTVCFLLGCRKKYEIKVEIPSKNQRKAGEKTYENAKVITTKREWKNL
jgi:hypothetical protein